MTMKRREALKAIGGLVGAAGAARALGGCGDDGGGGGPGRIDTFVFLMMENRSYDHVFGSRSLLEGLPGDGPAEGLRYPDSGGTPVDIVLSGDAELCALDPPHNWNAAHLQFNAGACDRFLAVHQQSHPGTLDAIRYLGRQHQPVSYALADAYTSCDRWFSSVLGGTLPNRMYWHAGTSNGATTNDEVLDGAFRGVQSLYHRLDDAGVDWAYYFGDAPVLAQLEDIELTGRIRRFNYEFFDDAAAGRLPPVVYVDPAFAANDDHPPHHPLLGQQLIAAVYTALATSPQWERCLLVVTYDENGGFFDHVAPPSDAVDARAALGFDQLGFRVPAVVAGPYARQGHVSSVRRDHTSPLKHLEDHFGLAPLTARSSAASDLLECLDLDRLAAGEPAAPIELPAVEIDESALSRSCQGSSLRGFDHDILAWAETANLGPWDLRGEVDDYVHAIADYLDRHGRGRIRRR
jgi:phospholipase C